MKIYCNLPETIKSAIRENLPGVEFTTSAESADIILPAMQHPIRLGEVIDQINSLKNSSLKLGELLINLTVKTISKGNTSLNITEKEAEIIKYLANAKESRTREEMLENIWGYASDANTKTVESHIYRLRSKISETFGEEIISSDNGTYKIIR